MPDYEFTEHAKQMIAEREIAIEWVERVLNNPVKIEQDQDDPTLRHALGRITEYGNRVLRVVYNETTEPKRIVTVYFDRKMKDKL